MKPAHLLPLFIIVAIVLGCSRISELANTSAGNRNSSPGDTASSNSAGPAAPGQFAPGGDPRADIEKLSERFLEVKAFKAKMAGQGQTPMETEMEFAAPDRYRIRTGTGMEMIVIGNTSYMKLGDKWQKMPMPLDSALADARAAFNKEGMKWISDVKYVGEDTANGEPAYVYTYHGKGPQGEGENDSKIWIARSNGLPVKVESTYRAGSLRSMTIDYDYRSPVQIEPPVK